MARTSRQLRPAARSAETFETTSGLGGSFTVSIIEDLGADKVLVRVHYPSGDWDGYRFAVSRSALRPTGKRVQVAA